jgi:hypothetical protein
LGKIQAIFKGAEVFLRLPQRPGLCAQVVEVCDEAIELRKKTMAEPDYSSKAN